MDPFLFAAKWLWVPMILVTLLNYGILSSRAQTMVQGDPVRQAGYAHLLKVYYFSSLLPFIVMGIGIVFGGVPTMFHFFRPQDGNPFVLAFFATSFMLWILGVYWVYFRGGAQTLARHPGVITKSENPLLIKLMVLFGLVAGIAAVFMLYQLDFPVDAFFGT